MPEVRRVQVKLEYDDGRCSIIEIGLLDSGRWHWLLRTPHRKQLLPYQFEAIVGYGECDTYCQCIDAGMALFENLESQD